MRIESLSSKPDRAGRFYLKLDSGETLRLYRQTIEDFELAAGQELTGETYVRLKESAGAYSAKMRAVRIVSASNVSKKSLEERLIRKGEDENQARAAVQWMEELHLVDDRETAFQLVERCISKGYGKARAKQMLYEKQIPRELWENVLENYPDQLEYIVQFLRSRLHQEADAKQIKKVVDALIRRGHSYHMIRQGLDLLGAENLQEEETWQR